MFNNLTDRFKSAFRNLTGRGKLTEANIQDAMAEIRTALLDADVNYAVAKKFVADVSQECLGEAVMNSVTPGQLAVKIVNDKLTALLGQNNEPLNLVSKPSIIMLCGLHGSGKTTTSAKLALHLKDKLKRKPLLVGCDLYRPAAIDQIEVLAKELNVDVFTDRETKNVNTIARRAISYAQLNNLDTIILDTAGRLQIDNDLVKELVDLKAEVKPDEIILVGDSALGQEAVSVAEHFDQALGITGIILTKLDGDARGGAALSVVSVVGCPILRIGVGEQPDDLEPFHPDRMASRILGMGDVVSLVEKVQATVDADEAARLQDQVIGRGRLTLEDLLAQMRQLKRFGSLSKIMDLLPGGASIPRDMRDRAQTEGMARMKISEAVILSMTPRERRHPEILDARRRRRIAAGSGTTVADVNDLIRQFNQMRKMAKRMKGLSRFMPRPH
ncbi:MAG: signal recognition particle protein [Kiritimatiellae bacterium]|nr:signal recognition particle protein [Kiritimatiellia bacterium]